MKNISALTHEAASCPAQTHGAFGLEKLASLAHGLSVESQLPAASRLFNLLSHGWADTPLSPRPPWRCDITDDGTPFEFSVAFSESRTELRLLAEPQERPFDLESNWAAGLKVSDAFRHEPGVDLVSFQRVHSLFAPRRGATGQFAIWYGGAVEKDEALSFKVYFNPEIHGTDLARAVVRNALAELEAEYAWKALASALSSSCRLLYFSLDLAATPCARVKIYIAHNGATPAELDERIRDLPGYRKGLAQSWVEELNGYSGRFDVRPLITCHSFQSPTTPAEVTVHVPTRCYVDNDADAVLRAGQVLGDRAAALLSGIEALAQRPLEVGRGLVTYVSLRPGGDRPRVTVYLAPEAHAISAPRHVSSAPALVPDARYHAVATSPYASMLDQLRTPRPPQVRTFAAVEAAIAENQAAFSVHHFLAALEGHRSIKDLQRTARRLTFYVMCFQDVLRLATQMTGDPTLKEICVRHEAEDRGHDAWFLSDLDSLGVDVDLRWTFSSAHSTTRDSAYRLIASTISAQHDVTRLAVVLCLEAVGAEFFGRFIGALARLKRTDRLLYFARSHQKIEESHTIFDVDAAGALSDRKFDAGGIEEALAAVTSTFRAMGTLADHLAGDLGGGENDEEAGNPSLSLATVR